MGRGSWACGGRLKGRCEARDPGAQLERGGLVIEAVVCVCGMRLFGGRGDAWVARSAGQGGCLGADDRRRPVDLTEVSERNLRGKSAMRGVVVWAKRARQRTVKSIFLAVLSPRPHDAVLDVREGGSSGWLS